MSRGAEQRRWAADIRAMRPRCAFCNSQENLHAHHVLKYEQYPAHRADKKNGMTVCMDCHLRIHTPGGGFGKNNI